MFEKDYLIERIIHDFPFLSNKSMELAFKEEKIRHTRRGRIYSYYGDYDNNDKTEEVEFDLNNPFSTTKESTLAEIFSFNPNHFDLIKNNLPYKKFIIESLRGPNIYEFNDKSDFSNPAKYKIYDNSALFFLKFINRVLYEDESNLYTIGFFNPSGLRPDKLLMLTNDKGVRSDRVGIEVPANIDTADYQLERIIDIIIRSKEKLDQKIPLNY
ncbi:MAG: hypothetical protein WC867_05885 [Candidatus Pacearchaeota archaeon]|jgi:hypothetical protein